MNVLNKLFHHIVKSIKNIITPSSLFDLLRTILAFIISIAIAFIVILIVSEEPIQTIRYFIISPLQDEYSRSEIINRAIPLIFSGLAASIMLKVKQFNMFGEGAFMLGGFVGAISAIYFNLPVVILPIIALLVGGISGGIIGTIPAYLKVKLNVNEFVTSLMLNFIVMWIVVYFLGNVFNDPTAGDITTNIIPEIGRIPYLSQTSLISYSFIIALIITLIIFVMMYYTRFGFRMKQTGDNIEYAKYVGIHTSKSIFYSQVIGSGVAAIGGATEVLSNYTRFNWKTLPGYGFDGFMIAIIANNNPLLVLLVALFFGYIRTGANQMAIFTDVSSEIVVIIQAVIILLVAAQSFLSKYKKKILFKQLNKPVQTRNNTEVI